MSAGGLMHTGWASIRKVAPAVALLFFLPPAKAPAQTPPIHGGRSNLTVHVSKSGLFSAFAHNHEIEAPIASGDVAVSGALSVSLRVDARRLRILDPEVSAGDRAKIQATMEGAEVLDAEHFKE